MTESLYDRGLSGVVMAHLVYFKAALYKMLILLVRYPINTLGRLMSLYAIFLTIFFGGTVLAGKAVSDSLEGIIVGFFLWTMAVAAYSGVASDFMDEAQWGTLEQLYMSPLGFGRVTFIKVVISIIDAFLWGGIILVLMLLTTGRELHVDVITVGPVLMLTIFTAIGVGLAMGGLSLYYKRIGQFISFAQFVFIGFIATPPDNYEIVRLLPLSHGNDLLNRAMVEGTRLWEFPIVDLTLLVGIAVAYLVVGYLVYGWFVRRARRDGVLDHY